MIKYLFFILLTGNVYANIEFSVGSSSAFSGRSVNVLNLSYLSNDLLFSATSGGVQNNYYYHSAYTFSVYKYSKIGDFIIGPMNFGAGAGIYFAQKGFDESLSGNIKTDSDFVIGPSFKMNWSFYRFLFLNMEALYGLRDLGTHLTLNFQEIISLSVGVRF